MRFQGTKNYIATEDLKLAVDAALNLEKPLLVKGEPGTGKTMLAVQVAIKLLIKCINENTYRSIILRAYYIKVLQTIGNCFGVTNCVSLYQREIKS